jgi:hypothetical protein
MHASIRRYEGVDVSRTDEVVGKINETLVPKLRELPGFTGYFLIEGSSGVLSSLGLFETSEQADKSAMLVSKWMPTRTSIRRFRTRRRSRAAGSSHRAPGTPGPSRFADA